MNKYIVDVKELKEYTLGLSMTSRCSRGANNKVFLSIGVLWLTFDLSIDLMIRSNICHRFVLFVGFFIYEEFFLFQAFFIVVVSWHNEAGWN